MTIALFNQNNVPMDKNPQDPFITYLINQITVTDQECESLNQQLLDKQSILEGLQQTLKQQGSSSIKSRKQEKPEQNSIHLSHDNPPNSELLAKLSVIRPVYSTSAPIRKKIALVLSVLQSSTSEEIAQSITYLEGVRELPHKIRQSISSYLSIMAKDEQLKVSRKDGKRRIYTTNL